MPTRTRHHEGRAGTVNSRTTTVLVLVSTTMRGRSTRVHLRGNYYSRVPRAQTTIRNSHRSRSPPEIVRYADGKFVAPTANEPAAAEFRGRISSPLFGIYAQPGFLSTGRVISRGSRNRFTQAEVFNPRASQDRPICHAIWYFASRYFKRDRGERDREREREVRPFRHS